MDISLSKLQDLVKEGKPGVLRFMRSQRVGHDRATERTELNGASHITCGYCVSFTLQWPGFPPLLHGVGFLKSPNLIIQSEVRKKNTNRAY